MKKPLYKKWWFIVCAALIVIYGLSALTLLFDDEEEPAKADTVEKKKPSEPSFKEKAVSNADEYPAKSASILYGTEYKGMEYFFEGEVVNLIIVEGNESALVKNKEGYVMPINTFENKVKVGQNIKVYGNLSGDGYANKDLNVDNVVGMTGYINATIVE